MRGPVVFRHRLMSLVENKGSDMSNYMTIEALEDGLEVSHTIDNCEYCIDGGDWIVLPEKTKSPAINKGHIISFKANRPQVLAGTGIGGFTISKKCRLKGNCMSMIRYDDATSYDTVYANYFSNLFSNCTTIVSVAKDFLPATKMSGNKCYYQMFKGCTSLVDAPDLPIVSLNESCYEEMFSGCVSLVNAPTISATRMGSYCCRQMFYDCKALEVAPSLSALSLSNGCYKQMFYGCSSMVSAPELPADNLPYEAYSGMFYGCSRLEVSPSLPALSLGSYCYQYMFRECVSLITPPELPATDLEKYCYSYMFYGCRKLQTAPSLPATKLQEGCYYVMFRYCDVLRDTPVLPAEELVKSCYGYMFSYCPNISHIKALFITSPGSDTTESWVAGVASSGTFVKNKNATWDLVGSSGVPEGWAVEYD